ncbi:hypothetical protein M569_17649, partial [Genlisea aurea]
LLQLSANALVMNHDLQTPLDVARANGYANVVRAIEGHLCLFSGWLLELYGPDFLNVLVPQLLSRNAWVVILPCGSRNNRKPLKLELAIYTTTQDAQPRTIVPLWKSKLDEPNFNLPEPVAFISVVSRIPRRWRKRRAISSSQEARRARIKLAPMSLTEREQLRRFCNACKGIPQQVMNQSIPFRLPVPTVPPHIAAIRADISASDVPSTSQKPAVASKCEVEEAASKVPQDESVSIPSAPPTSDSPPVHYPSIDTSPKHDDDRVDDGSCCTICLDAPVEGACVPCGHMAGCMSCLNEVRDKNWGCPVCRAKIDQVIRIYSV